jgi:hypothetical protein
MKLSLVVWSSAKDKKGFEAVSNKMPASRSGGIRGDLHMAEELRDTADAALWTTDLQPARS